MYWIIVLRTILARGCDILKGFVAISSKCYETSKKFYIINYFCYILILLLLASELYKHINCFMY